MTKNWFLLTIMAATASLCGCGTTVTSQPSTPESSQSTCTRPSQAKVRLKLQPGAIPYDLRVSSDGLWACFSEASIFAQPGRQPMRLVDLRSGKMTTLDCLLSPIGEKAVIFKSDKAYVLDLRTMKRRDIPLAKNQGIWMWMGNKLIVVTYVVDDRGIIQSYTGIKSYNPEDGKVVNFSSIGCPVAADSGGKTLLTRVGAEAPDRPLTDDGDSWFVSLDGNGQIARTLCKDYVFRAVVSPSSLQVAFMTGVETANADDDKKCAATIVDIKLGTTTSIRVTLDMIGITDSGNVLTAEASPDPVAVKLHRDGKVTTLVEAARSPTYAGNRLYYIDGTGPDSVLMSVEVPN